MLKKMKIAQQWQQQNKIHELEAALASKVGAA